MSAAEKFKLERCRAVLEAQDRVRAREIPTSVDAMLALFRLAFLGDEDAAQDATTKTLADRLRRNERIED